MKLIIKKNHKITNSQTLDFIGFVAPNIVTKEKFGVDLGGRII